MDRALVIERNSEALFRVVAAMVAMAWMAGGRLASVPPRHVRRAALINLRAEDLRCGG